MIELYGKKIGKPDLLARIGSLAQVAGIRMMELQDGPERGVRVADVRTGSGLRFQVSLDRGMDIAAAEYKGMPLAWRSPTGDAHPAYFDRHGAGWTRTFPGGLMTGCGMTYAGAAGRDEGEELGLHGRLSHLAAFDVASSTHWEDGQCCFHLEGSVRESATFRENLLLRRTIETGLGSSVITIRDQVVNEGHSRSPLMMLYHVNAGWPLVDRGSRLLLHARDSRPRDAVAAPGLSEARVFTAPVCGYREQVFYHDLIPDAAGFGTALLQNDTLAVGMFVRFRMRELPRYIEWKMMGEGEYVVGMEPANCLVGGRAAERAAGTLCHLEPQESTAFELQIGLLDDPESLARFSRENELQ
ncbi:MAG TPA: aldose 1-epimerase family protein [Bacteroidota bacterium]